MPSFVDDWGTSQQSMFGLDRFLKRRHQNGKLQGFQGLGDVKCGGKIFFLLSDSSDIVLFHYFFTLWQTCWSLSFPKTKWLICINIRYKITDWLVLNQAHDEITRFFFFLTVHSKIKQVVKRKTKVEGVLANSWLIVINGF